MKRYFPEEKIQMANTYKKIYLSFSITREMQIKTATRCVFSVIRLGKLFKPDYIKSGQRWEKMSSPVISGR